MRLQLKSKAKKYFKTFSNKDLDGLSEMFSDDVRLEDWEQSAEGKIAVLEANKKIFSSVDTIEVSPTALYRDNNTIVAELIICVDRQTNILVVDILDFDDDGKIRSIKAYKGN
tara:strand:- start:3714 stop:4052 length:339 start_codon:yes stop_codon:yes gene_type:complete